jgi:hypothetical protein
MPLRRHLRATPPCIATKSRPSSISRRPDMTSGGRRRRRFGRRCICSSRRCSRNYPQRRACCALARGPARNSWISPSDFPSGRLSPSILRPRCSMCAAPRRTAAGLPSAVNFMQAISTRCRRKPRSMRRLVSSSRSSFWQSEARTDFFLAIAARLRPGGILASSDLASDVNSPAYETLLHTWLNMLSLAGIPAAGLDQMRAAYAKDVAILPPQQVESFIHSAGFDEPVQFYQAGLIHAWYAMRKCN